MVELLKHIYTEYAFWLIVMGIIVWLLEHFRPWRKDQGFVRKELGQDFFWLIFNGVLATYVFVGVFSFINGGLDGLYLKATGTGLHDIRVIGEFPLWAQCLIVLVSADLIEWCTHNLLHRVPWLWKIHRVHHSIEIMDWIGNFRFHWGEIILYKSIKYIPLALLGAQWQAILIVAVFATAIGNLNHANVNISWGPLRYLFNSPCMHIWHHDKKVRGKAGVNFGIVLSVWDWLFKTAYMPNDLQQPKSIGYHGQQNVSNSLFARFFYPWRSKNNDSHE